MKVFSDVTSRASNMWSARQKEMINNEMTIKMQGLQGKKFLRIFLIINQTI